MAIVERVARVRLADALNNFREWTATAATRDTPAGGEVVITVASTSGGASPPAVADAFQLKVVREDGTSILAYPQTSDPLPFSRSFFFTVDGLAAAALRAGTAIIDLRVIKTSGVGTYDVDSDGTPNSPPAGFTSTLDRGWIRGTTTAAVTLSRTQGGAAATDFAYGDSVWHRIVLEAALYSTRSFTHRLRRAGQPDTLSAPSGAAATQTFDANLGVARPSNIPVVDTYIGDLTVPNSALTGQPAVVLTTTTTDDAPIDTRLTITRHLQINTNTFATPPVDAGNERPSADLGFVAARVTNARGEGVNQAGGSGLGISYSLADVRALVAPLTLADQSTQMRGGQDGWGPLMPWSSSLPAGDWENTVTFRDAAGLQATAVRTYTLLAINPSIVVVAGGGSANDGGSHFVPGHVLIAALQPMNISTGRILDEALDALSEPQVALARMNTVTRKPQHFDGATWVDTGSGEVTWFNAIKASALNPAWGSVYIRTFGPGGLTNVDTSGWGMDDVIVVGRIKVQGTRYGNYMQIPVVGDANAHSGYAFDILGHR